MSEAIARADGARRPSTRALVDPAAGPSPGRGSEAKALSGAKRQGATATFLVVCTSVVITTWLAAGASTTDPLLRDVRRAAARAQAQALAEAGVQGALAEARRGERPASVSGLRVGDGTVDVEVRSEEDEVVVRATGRAQAGALLGPGGRLQAVVVVRLRGERIVAWEELP